MTSLSAKFSGRRRALWVFLVTALASVACSGPGSRVPSDALGSTAGATSEGGLGDDEAGSGGAREDEAGGPSSAGAPLGNGGNAGAAGVAEAAGAAGTADVVDGGASGASSADFVPAPHQPYPVVTYHGGPVVKNIDLVPVYFGDDPLRDDLERFNTWLVTSNYWTLVGAEYGVQAGTRRAAVQFEKPSASPISDVQIASWIDARVADGTLPTPSANTVFILFYPADTNLTFGTSPSCAGFAGFHKFSSIANPVFTGNVPFVVIPRCSFSPGDELMVATNVASHELFEAATDAQSPSNPAWFMDSASGPLEAWQILTGAEVADLCENQSYDVIDGFTVQDIWSNSAAQAGNNPCQPSDPKHPFFMVSADATIYHAEPGATLTIHAGAWSNMPTPDWSLGINWGLVPNSDFDGKAVLSKTTVNNGDELTATISVPASPPVVDGRSVYRFTIDSIDPINPNFSHPWPILIIVP
jgi:hypothetical protein